MWKIVGLGPSTGARWGWGPVQTDRHTYINENVTFVIPLAGGNILAYFVKVSVQS